MGSKTHGVYAAAAFAASVTLWYLRTDMQNFTTVILYMNIIYNAHGYKVLILKFYSVHMHLQGITNF